MGQSIFQNSFTNVLSYFWKEHTADMLETLATTTIDILTFIRIMLLFFSQGNLTKAFVLTLHVCKILFDFLFVYCQGHFFFFFFTQHRIFSQLQQICDIKIEEDKPHADVRASSLARRTPQCRALCLHDCVSPDSQLLPICVLIKSPLLHDMSYQVLILSFHMQFADSQSHLL